MPWHDLAEIQAWERINGPVGEERDDLRMGILASVMAAPHTKGSVSAMDYMPFREKPKQSSSEMLSLLEHAARAE